MVTDKLRLVKVFCGQAKGGSEFELLSKIGEGVFVVLCTVTIVTSDGKAHKSKHFFVYDSDWVDERSFGAIIDNRKDADLEGIQHHHRNSALAARQCLKNYFRGATRVTRVLKVNAVLGKTCPWILLCVLPLNDHDISYCSLFMFI